VAKKEGIKVMEKQKTSCKQSLTKQGRKEGSQDQRKKERKKSLSETNYEVALLMKIIF
jgi:hypothetical protein